MARQISDGIKTLLESGEGIEPIMVLGITWVNGKEYHYADRDIGDPLNPAVRGKVLEFGQLEDVTRLDGSGTATSISVTLDDSDGSIKGFMNGIDLIFRPVNVYQFFNGLSESIVLFEGVLATPIEWDEGTRTVKLTAITRQTSQMVGFSLDESNVPVYHQDLLNKPWPMVFGSPLYSPTLALVEIPAGTIIHGFGTPSQSLDNQINQLEGELSAGPGIFIADTSGFDPVTGLNYSTEDDFDAAYSAAIAWSKAQESKAISLANELDTKKGQESQAPFRPYNNIVGGYRFPQGKKLICRIGEKLFKVIFLGGDTVPDNPEKDCPVHVEQFLLPLAYYRNTPTDTGGFFQAGSKIELVSELPDGYHYVASITPGIVQGVYAYRTFNGIKRLTPIPKRYWSIKTEATGGLDITYIVFPRAMSTLTYYDNWKVVFSDDLLKRYESGNEYPYISNVNWVIDWEDTIYVNFQSTIGPNVVDILIWIIEKYTPYKYDLTSFNYVKARVSGYPANFCLTERPVADELIQDISYQARCAVWIKNNVYYIKYLPDTAYTVGTLTESHIIAKSMKISASGTDELVTKYVATWQPDYIHPKDTLVLKNNVAKYGIIEESHDFFIYNNLDLVLHTATFWLIRKSHIWKIVTCDVTLDMLTLETLDDVLLQLSKTTVSFGDVACQIESCQYNSDSNSISLTLWTGIRFGEMIPYIFARPANISKSAVFPLFRDIEIGARPIPKIPKYNNIQSNIQAPTSDSPIGSPRVNENGYVLNTRPISQGTIYPADYPTANDPVPFDPEYDYLPEPAPDTPLDDPDITPPFDSGDISRAVPGKVISGGGKNWQVECYPKGLTGTPVTVNAAEAHQDPSLAGIVGEWVTVYRSITSKGEKTYSFFTAHSVAMPVSMLNNEQGNLYPKGFPAEPLAGKPVKQLQIATSFTVPPNTVGIAVRIWDGDSFIYQVQIPVWLPKTT